MRTIQSPGVEIRERDISQTAVLPTGTNVFLAGFSQKGPTDEPLRVSSVQELEQIYGTPATPAERYFYYTAKQILVDSSSTLYVNRMPYGDDMGYGFGSKYGALVFPVMTLSALNSNSYSYAYAVSGGVIPKSRFTNLDYTTWFGRLILSCFNAQMIDGVSIDTDTSVSARIDNRVLFLSSHTAPDSPINFEIINSLSSEAKAIAYNVNLADTDNVDDITFTDMLSVLTYGINLSAGINSKFAYVKENVFNALSAIEKVVDGYTLSASYVKVKSDICYRLKDLEDGVPASVFQNLKPGTDLLSANAFLFNKSAGGSFYTSSTNAQYLNFSNLSANGIRDTSLTTHWNLIRMPQTSMWKLISFFRTFSKDQTTATNSITALTAAYFTGPEIFRSYTTAPTNEKATYLICAPKFFELDKDQYQSVIDGTAFTWKSTRNYSTTINAVSDFGWAGFIVLNKGLTITNAQAEGYYVGIADNFNAEPTSDFDSIRSAYTVTKTTTNGGFLVGDLTQIPSTRLNFILSASNKTGVSMDETALSRSLEKSFDAFPEATTSKFDDTVAINVYKLKRSPYSPDSIKMDYSIDRKYFGSFDYNRRIGNQYGAVDESFYIYSQKDDNRNTQIIVNDYISNRIGESWLGTDGTPTKKVRVLNYATLKQLKEENPNAQELTKGYLRHGGVYYHDYVQIMRINTATVAADSLYPLGPYVNNAVAEKSLGDIPAKVERALYNVENDEIYDIDLVVEGGLGTIYTTMKANITDYFDDTVITPNFDAGIEVLKSVGEYTAPSIQSRDLRGLYHTVFSKFDTFCSEIRRDCMFIADPLRQIFVRGASNKVLPNLDNSFSRDIYNALRHNFELANSNYSCTYGNWVKVYDSYSGANIWVPFSGFAAADFANTDKNYYPWYAPAGFTRGKIRNALELAVVPKQKERDMLYKIAINPVTFFPGEGFAIFGQKTLQRQPSAFDRINVRRLFLYLEKATKKAVKFFVFEPNTTFTRTRLVNTLNPIFDYAKSTEGLTDYLIVSDRRNNTPDSIDNNELVVDIYVKPVRAAEFILVNFIATRTGANFNELIAGPRV